MVMSFISSALGALTGLGRSSSAQNYASTFAGMKTQFDFDRALNEESYKYSTLLNNQSYDLSRLLTNYQYQLERESRRTSFNDTRKDLESAGYNPLLALGQQSNALNVGMSGPSNSFTSADSNSFFSALSTVGQLDKIKSDIHGSKYVNDLNLATAEKTRSETRGQDINNTIQDAYGMTRASIEIDNMKKQGILSERQADYYKKQIAVAESEIMVNSAQAGALKSQTDLNKQQYDLNEPERRFAVKNPIAHGTLNKFGRVGSAVTGMLPIRWNVGYSHKF